MADQRSSGSVRVRAGTDADVSEVTTLWAKHGGPTRTPPDEGAVRRLVNHDPEALLILEVDGQVVGTIVAGFDGWRCHIYRLVVAPASRRRGFANVLLDAAVQRTHAIGGRRIDAMVDSTNETGAAFWQASRFELDAEEQRWSLFLRPSTVQDDDST